MEIIIYTLIIIAIVLANIFLYRSVRSSSAGNISVEGNKFRRVKVDVKLFSFSLVFLTIFIGYALFTKDYDNLSSRGPNEYRREFSEIIVAIKYLEKIQHNRVRLYLAYSNKTTKNVKVLIEPLQANLTYLLDNNGKKYSFENESENESFYISIKPKSKKYASLQFINGSSIEAERASLYNFFSTQTVFKENPEEKSILTISIPDILDLTYFNR